MYQLARSQQVDPEAKDCSKLSTRLIVKVPLEHPLEGIEPRKHGEEQRVEVASDCTTILSTSHLDIRVISNNFSCPCHVLEIDEFHGSFNIASNGSTS